MPSSILILLLFLAAPLKAVEDKTSKKRGGFTQTTPKPAVKKSTAAEPTPKKKPRPTGEIASEVKKVPASETSVSEPPKREHAPAATVAAGEIAEFAAQSPRVQALIGAALELTKLNLTYTYGSADPGQGGMDCSGAMYYLLRSQGFDEVPRDSSGQYVWARKAGPFFAVVSKSAESFEFRDLSPGDLLFWTGTYTTGREIPISHVMLYLGTEKKTKKRIMFGSSDGRSYAGVQRWGVSVFDFKMPTADPANPEKAKVDFVGYGRIPGLRDRELAEVKVESVAEVVAEPKATPKASPTAKKKRKSGAVGN